MKNSAIRKYIWRKDLSLAMLSYCTVLFTVLIFIGNETQFYEFVVRFGDTSRYLNISEALYTCDFEKLNTEDTFYGHFYGFPLFIVLTKAVTNLSLLHSMLLVSFISYITIIYLTTELFGENTTIWTIIFGWAILQRGVFGGSGPLFIALLLIAMYAIKNEKVFYAILFASLGTLVRPWGITLLVAIGANMLFQKKYKELILSVLLSMLIGGLYVYIISVFTGSILTNRDGYAKHWYGASMIWFPFVGVIKGFIQSTNPITNTAKISFYIMLSLTGLYNLIRHYKVYFNNNFQSIVGTYYILFLFLLYTYNTHWAWFEFPRFFAPILPVTLFYLNRFLPTDISSCSTVIGIF